MHAAGATERSGLGMLVGYIDHCPLTAVAMTAAMETPDVITGVNDNGCLDNNRRLL